MQGPTSYIIATGDARRDLVEVEAYRTAVREHGYCLYIDPLPAGGYRVTPIPLSPHPRSDLPNDHDPLEDEPTKHFSPPEVDPERPRLTLVQTSLPAPARPSRPAHSPRTAAPAFEATLVAAPATAMAAGFAPTSAPATTAAAAAGFAPMSAPSTAAERVPMPAAAPMLAMAAGASATPAPASSAERPATPAPPQQAPAAFSGADAARHLAAYGGARFVFGNSIVGGLVYTFIVGRPLGRPRLWGWGIVLLSAIGLALAATLVLLDGSIFMNTGAFFVPLPMACLLITRGDPVDPTTGKRCKRHRNALLVALAIGLALYAATYGLLTLITE